MWLCSIRGGIGVFYDVLKAEDNLQYNGQAPFFGFADLFPDPLPNNNTAGSTIFSSACRSTLPWMVRGNASTRTNVAGTMQSGNRERRKTLRSDRLTDEPGRRSRYAVRRGAWFELWIVTAA